MDFSNLPFIVEPMQVQDIDEVVAIDRISFSTPWSANAYRSEIEENKAAHYYVVRAQEVPESVSGSEEGDWRERVRRWLSTRLPEHGPRPILGYGGFWLMLDEAHISTIAVRPEYRRRGLGELLIVTMVEDAISLHARHVTLEVRVTNFGAQQLYHKYGFQVVGRRKGYYTDNREDALLMTLYDIQSPVFQAKLAHLAAELRQKMMT